MFTFVTTAKPFLGHNAIIQRNAIRSWLKLRPDVQVILFGDEEGAAATAQELQLRHEPHVERNKAGSKRLDFMLARAQVIARHDFLCYINCDIILMDDFCLAFEQVKTAHPQFLMVGRRWDLDVTEPYDFKQPDWQARLRMRAMQNGRQRTPEWIDYFAFPRGLYGPDIPPFVIGRVFWDNWLLWKAGDSHSAVVDVSSVVTTVHQNHNYAYHVLGRDGVWSDEQAARNYELAGGWKHLRTIEDATHVLGEDGLRPNRRRAIGPR